MKSFIRDNSFSLLTLVLSVTCVAVAFQYPADSSGFPRAIAIFLMTLSIADLVRKTSARRHSDQVLKVSDGDMASSGRQYTSAVLIVSLSAPAYVALVKLFDFEIATFVFLVAGMLLLGIRKPVLIVSVAIGVLIAVKLLFFVLLDVTRSSTLIFGT